MNNTAHTSHHFVKFGYYALVTAVGAAVVYCLYLFAVPLVGSFLCVFLLDPIVNFFETRGMKRLWVIVGIYLFIVVAAACVVFFVGPPLAKQARTFVQDIPRYKALLANTIGTLQTAVAQKFPQANIPDINEMLGDRMPKVNIDALIAYSSSFFSFISLVVLIPVVTFFLLADGHLIEKVILEMVPNRYFEMVFMLFHKVTTALKLFLRGQCIDAGAVGIMTIIGLSIIGLPYAIVIGIIAGFGNLIPYLGPIIGFMPALLVILATGGFSIIMLIKVIIVFVLVQFIEGTFVYPIAVGKSVDLHPLVVIIGVTIGGQLGGIIGMLAAIPIISVLKVSIEVLHASLKSYSII